MSDTVTLADDKTDALSVRVALPDPVTVPDCDKELLGESERVADALELADDDVVTLTLEETDGKAGAQRVERLIKRECL